MNSGVSFLLGAGASQPYGVPTMAGFYSSFRQHLMKRHPKHFALLERLEQGRPGTTHDLETLLADLQLATSTAAGLQLLQVTVPGDLLPTTELAELRGFLDAFIIDTCERFDRERSAQELMPLLRLHELGPLWVFTTNYDRIVEQACDQHSLEYSDGFDAPVGNPVADYRGEFGRTIRVVKLHGSVNWYQDTPGGGLHRLDRGYSLPTKDFALVREGQRLIPLMIIPTLEKQVLDRPYAQLATRFTDVLRDCPLLVVAGNSLRDRHLLNYISDRMPRLQVLLLSPNASTNRVRLGLGEGSHALDVGFSELLTTSGAALGHLSSAVLKSSSVAEVAAAVGTFIREVTDNAKASAALRANPALAVHEAALGDASIAQRARAATALGGYAHPGVVHRLAMLLKSEPSEDVRAAAVGALLTIGTSAAIDDVFTALSDRSKAVQLEAVTGLLSRPPDLSILARLDQAKGDLHQSVQDIINNHVDVTSAVGAQATH